MEAMSIRLVQRRIPATPTAGRSPSNVIANGLENDVSNNIVFIELRLAIIHVGSAAYFGCVIVLSSPPHPMYLHHIFMSHVIPQIPKEEAFFSGYGVAILWRFVEAVFPMKFLQLVSGRKRAFFTVYHVVIHLGRHFPC